MIVPSQQPQQPRNLNDIRRVTTAKKIRRHNRLLILILISAIACASTSQKFRQFALSRTPDETDCGESVAIGIESSSVQNYFGMRSPHPNETSS